MRTTFLIPAQLIACMAAGGVVKAMFPGDMASLNTTLAPGVNIAQGLFAEMFFTSYLVFVVLMLAAEKSKDTFLAPVGIGLALFVAEIPGKLCAHTLPPFDPTRLRASQTRGVRGLRFFGALMCNYVQVYISPADP